MRRSLVTLALVGLIAGGLSVPPSAQADPPRAPEPGALPAGTLAVGTRAFAPATEAYDPSHLVWAKGSRIHDGGEVIDLGRWRVHEMQRTPHGFFVDVSRARHDDHRLGWYDGHRLTWIGPGASMPNVSPDGRLAGWADRGGPRIDHGRSGRIVVVDLLTGRVVFSTSRWMGDDTDLYEEIYASFLGFDGQYAYWNRVTGDVRRVRTDLTTWATSPAATVDEDGWERPVGLPLDPYTGTPVTLDDGQPSTDGIEPGFVSPDGRFAFNVSATARLKITDAATGARVDPEWDSRWRWFAGWQDADTVYVALPKRFSYVHQPHERTRVRVAACDLPAGTCTTVARLRGPATLVLGAGPEA